MIKVYIFNKCNNILRVYDFKVLSEYRLWHIFDALHWNECSLSQYA